MGIEPTLVAWEATVLPLNYTRARGPFYCAMGPLCSGQAVTQNPIPGRVATPFLRAMRGKG